MSSTVYVPYERTHLAGIVALCAAEGWPSYPADRERAHRALTAPGVTTIVAMIDEEVVGFAQLQSDGEIQAHLSLIAVDTSRRGEGIGRALISTGFARAGGIRVDLVTDTAHEFYSRLPGRRMDGFRIYPETE